MFSIWPSLLEKWLWRIFCSTAFSHYQLTVTEGGTSSKLKVVYHLFRMHYDIYCFHLEVEPKDLDVEMNIERMEMDRGWEDYRSNRDDCTLRLHCRVSQTRKDRIKSGSCFFRYDNWHFGIFQWDGHVSGINQSQCSLTDSELK